MGFSRVPRGSKAADPKKARYMRGDCGICHKMIMPGQSYFTCVGGKNTGNGYLAHIDCYNPH